MPIAAAAPNNLKDTLEEMRASVAARGARKGLSGAIEAAILGLLEVLLALLADFRDGRLAPPATACADAAGGAVADPSPSSRIESAGEPAAKGGNGSASERADNNEFASDTLTPALPRLAGEGACGAGGAVAYPSPSLSVGPHRTGAMGTRIKGRGIRGRSQDHRLARLRGSLRPRRFERISCAKPAAFAAAAGDARRSPRFPALRRVVRRGTERADSKNGVFGERDSADHIVAT